MIAKPDKILIIQLRRIGDVVLTTPVLEVIKKNYPEAKIDFLVEPPANEILENNPNINRIHTYEKNKSLKWILKIRKLRYDWVIDFLGNPRSETIAALSGAKIKAGPANVFWRIGYNKILTKIEKPDYAAAEKIKMLSALGVTCDDETILPKVYLGDEHRTNAKNILLKVGVNVPLKDDEFLVGFSPTSRKITRRYPEKNWIELAKIMLERLNCKIMVFWGPGEKDTAKYIVDAIGDNRVFLSPEIKSLKNLAAVLKHCEILITNCNGTKHIATAVNTSTLTIHGASSPVAWTPKGFVQHQYIKNENLNCSPCTKNTCSKDIECMRELAPELVYEKAFKIISILAKQNTSFG